VLPGPVPVTLPVGASFPSPVQPDSTIAMQSAKAPARGVAASKNRPDAPVRSEAGSPGSPEAGGLGVGR
jgi:hypothetical protein